MESGGASLLSHCRGGGEGGKLNLAGAGQEGDEKGLVLVVPEWIIILLFAAMLLLVSRLNVVGVTLHLMKAFLGFLPFQNYR